MDKMEKIVSLAKRRGFVFPGSEIYGGLANTYDYGPMGVELMRNIKNAWWDFFVTKRPNIYGLDSSVLMSPKVWQASGHTASFTDVLVDCKECNYRTRADHLIENYFAAKGIEKKVEGLTPEELGKIIANEKIPCPKCKGSGWTTPRMFNLLFETEIGMVEGDKKTAYLRGEIAQGMFVNFKHVLDSMSPKLPFGLAQSGSAFRNEITLGRFVYRTLQFNLAEFEYFFDPKAEDWEEVYGIWKKEMWDWTTKILGIDKNNLRWREHTTNERSHYSKMTEDIEYQFPFGFKELYGLAYRTDFDLKNHMEQSGVDLRYTDSQTGNKFIPHVVEPTFGLDRSFLALMLEHYCEEEKRVVLKLPSWLSPYRAAVFPLLSNKEKLLEKAEIVFGRLANESPTTWDGRGNIGKRYLAQDEIGTPYCITIDFNTLRDDSVTVRNRDTTKQDRVNIDKLPEYIENDI